MIKQFRKKPVIIEAIQYEGDNSNVINQWSNGVVYAINPQDEPNRQWLNVKTLEGIMSANVGDWIIRGVKGEFYPCKSDIFEATYEQV